MSIDNLTFGELKQIAAMFAGLQPTTSLASVNIANPVVGKFCIARCYSAGVHAGEVVSVDGENVVLKDSRRLWDWRAQDGIALSGVAQHGLKGECKLDSLNPVIYLTGVCELIPCTSKSQETIRG